jgi:hypothetical protein
MDFIRHRHRSCVELLWVRQLCGSRKPGDICYTASELKSFAKSEI